MTCRDLAARMLGAVTLATSWAICLWLRTVMLRPGNQPGLLEAALVLASFVLTLVGLLLLLNGARMLRHPGPAQPLPAPSFTAAKSPDKQKGAPPAGRATGTDRLTRRGMRLQGSDRKHR